MEFITEEIIERYSKENPTLDPYYYKNRWGYISEVIKLIKDFENKYNIKKVLEIGPYLLPIVHESDIIDNVKRDNLISDGKFILQDASEVPWDIEQYDLILALQVWEHLGTSQQKAFAEAQKHSKMLILSFPWMWSKSRDYMHNNINDNRIMEWTNNTTPTLSIKSGAIKINLYIF